MLNLCNRNLMREKKCESNFLCEIGFCLFEIMKVMIYLLKLLLKVLVFIMLEMSFMWFLLWLVGKISFVFYFLGFLL